MYVFTERASFITLVRRSGHAMSCCDTGFLFATFWVPVIWRGGGGVRLALSSARFVMEDLELLDAGLSAPGVSPAKASSTRDDDGSVSASGSHQYPNTPTPAKRRRTVAAPWPKAQGRRWKSSPAAKSKEEDREGGGPLVECSEGPFADPLVDDKLCMGCGRGSRSGRCYLNPNMVTPWAFPKGRGQWCATCHTTWRTCYEEHHPLGYFPQHLADERNALEFERRMVALLTLVAEGVPKATEGMILDRKRTLDIHMRLLGMHPPGSMVVLLSDLVQQAEASGTPLQLDANDLTTVRINGNDRIGIHMPSGACPPIPGDMKIPRPTSATGAPSLRSRMHLVTNCPDDVCALETAFGGEVAEANASASGSAAQSGQAEEASREAPSRLDAKFEMRRVGALVVLANFACEDWQETMKEGMISKPLQFMEGLSGEAQNVGDARGMENSQTWVAGLTHCKKFLKGMHEYKKSAHRHSKILDVVPHMIGVKPFLVDVAGLSLAYNFELLWHKCLFFKEFGETRSLTTATERLLIGFGELVIAMRSPAGLKVCDPKKVSIDVWLRGNLWVALGEKLSQATGVEMQVELSALVADVEGCLGLLEKAALDDEIPDLLEDLRCFLSVLKGGLEPPAVSAMLVSSAVGHLDHTRMVPLKRELDRNQFGKIVLAACAILLQVSAKDKVADDKSTRALTMLADSRMLGLSIPSNDSANSYPFIVNFSRVLDESVVEVMDESLAVMSEAMRLWTPLRLEQQIGCIIAWADAITSSTVFIDEVYALYMHGMVSQGSLGSAIAEVRSSKGLSDSLPQAQAIAEGSAPSGDDTTAKRLLGDNWLNENAFKSFVNRLSEYFDSSLPEVVSGNPQLAKHAERLANSTVKNIEARATVMSFIVEFENVPLVPTTSRDALEEWRSLHAIGKQEDSFLAWAMGMQSTLDLLKEQRFFFTIKMSGVVGIKLEQGSGVVSLLASLDGASSLPEDLAALPQVKASQMMLTDSLQGMIDLLAQELYLQNIRVPNASQMDDIVLEHVPEVPAMFLAPEAFLNSSEASRSPQMARVFGAAASQDEPGKLGKALVSLATTLFRSVPASSFKVSFGPFCRPGEKTKPTDCQEPAAAIVILDLLSCVSTVALSWASLKLRFIDQSQLCMKDNALRPDLLAAINLMRTSAHVGLSLVSSPTFNSQVQPWSSLAWVISPAQCKDFLLATRNIMPTVCKSFVMKGTDAIANLSQEVAQSTPQYSHIISDAKYNPTLAQKSLLGWPSRQLLSETTVKLHKAMRDLARAHAEMNLTPSLTDDPLFKDTLDAAMQAFEIGRKAIVTIAALSVLLEKHGAGQAQAAADLLENKRSLISLSLVRDLEKIASSLVKQEHWKRDA